MKRTLFYLFVLLAMTPFAQSIQQLTEEILVRKQGMVCLKTNIELEYKNDLYNDSLWIPEIESEYVFNTMNKTPPVAYYQKNVYQLPSGNQLRIDIMMDSIILLKEKRGYKTVRMGEVRIDTTLFLTYENAFFADNYGEDSVVIDTFYRVIPIGQWITDIDDVTCESGMFKNGKKDGVWKVISQVGTTVCLDAAVKEQVYSSGQLLDEKITGYIQPTDKDLIIRFLPNEWYNTRCFNFEEERNYFYGFKKTLDKIGGRVSWLDHLDINEDGSYIEKSYHWCGSCQQKPIESIWYLTNGNELVLDGYKYYIAYISETELLLEICIDSE